MTSVDPPETAERLSSSPLLSRDRLSWRKQFVVAWCQSGRGQVGVTTVGKVRALGGEVVPAPTQKNPNHATLGGLTPEQASSLFRPTVRNPN